METDNTSPNTGYEDTVVNSSLESTTVTPPEYNQPMPQPKASIGQRVLQMPKAQLSAMGIVIGIIVLAIIGGLLLLKSPKQQQLGATDNLQSTYAKSTLSTQGAQDINQLQVGQTSQLAINGKLSVGNTIVLSPTTAPTNPVAGQLYYGQDNQLYLYNGSQFISLSASAQSSSSLSSLKNSSVLSIQGQTGAITFSSGDGIAINGLKITNSGVTSITGTTNQISVSRSTGAIQLSLPQDIDPTASPSFYGLNLTGLGSNGILYTGSGTSNIGSLVAGTSGDCLVSTGSAPAWGSCASAAIDGTPGQIAMINGSGYSVGDSIIAQSGSTISINGSLSVSNGISGDGSGITDLDASNVLSGILPVIYGGTGADNGPDALANLGAAASGINGDITRLTDLSSIIPESSLTIGSSTETLTLQGSSSTTLSVTNDSYSTNLKFASLTGIANIVIPNTSGYVAVAATGPLELSSSGVLTCPDCLVSSGGNGGVSGVDSVNSDSGAININALQGYGLSVDNDTGNNIDLVLDQNISTTGNPQFDNLTLNGELGVGTSPSDYPINVNGDINVSGDYLINNTPICSDDGCLASGGSGSYIQNGTASQVGGANFNIQGVGGGNVVAQIQAADDQTANIFTVKNSTGTTIFDVAPNDNPDEPDNSGYVGIWTSSPQYPLDVNGDINTSSAYLIGGVTVCDSTDGCIPAPGYDDYIQNGTGIQSGTNFAIQAASTTSAPTAVIEEADGGQSTDLLDLDNDSGGQLFDVTAAGNAYLGGELGIGTTTPGYALDVEGSNGIINAETAIDVGGVPICSDDGCLANGGSGAYIQDSTASQTANFNIQGISTGDGDNVVAVIQGASDQSNDVLDVIDASNNKLFSVGYSGIAYVGNSLGIGITPSYALEVQGSVDVTGDYLMNGADICTSGGCTPNSGSGSYIQNNTSPQSANFYIISKASNTLPTVIIQQASEQTGDLLDFEDSGNGVVAGFNTSGELLIGGATEYVSELTIGTSSMSGPTDGISFGGSSNLYQESDGVLETTGSLVAANFTASGEDNTTGIDLQDTTSDSLLSTNLMFTDDESTPQSVGLREQDGNLAVINGSGDLQLAFSPSMDGILFGNSLDTDLYRSAADTLTTDGSLVVSGNFTNDGSALFEDSSDSYYAFEIRNSDNTNVLVADTKDDAVGIDTTTPPEYTLDVNGDTNISSGAEYLIGGSEICESGGCIPAPGYDDYIQNGTGIQSGTNFAIQAASTTSAPTAVIEEADGGQSTDLLDLDNDSGTAEAGFNVQGQLLLGGASGYSANLTIGTDSDTSSNEGISFGDDTNLFRGGSGLLETTSSFLQQTTSTGALEVEAVDASNPTLDIDTTDTAIGIGIAATSSYTLSVGGTEDVTGILTVASEIDANGGVTINSSSSLQNNGSTTLEGSLTANGSADFDDSSSDPNAFEVQGSGSNVLIDADNYSNAVAIDETPTALYALNVGDGTDGSISTDSIIEMQGVEVCTVDTCASSTGSGNYIQNGTALQGSANINIESNNGTYPTDATVQILQASGQTSDFLDIYDSSGESSGNLLDSINDKGLLTLGTSSDTGQNYGISFGGLANLFLTSSSTLETANNFLVKVGNSTTAFEVQNGAAGSSLLTVDTKNDIVTVGNSTAAITQTINVGDNSTADSVSNINIGSTVGGGSLVLQGSSIAETITGATDTILSSSSGSTEAFQIQNASGTVLDVDTTNGRLGIGTDAPTANLQVVTATNTTTALEVVSSSGSGSIPVLNVDTTDLGVAIGTASTGGYSLNVGNASGTTYQGSVNIADYLYIGGNQVCNNTGCDVIAGGTGGGSGAFIRDQTTPQSANFYVQSATSGQTTATLEANGNGDILNLQNSSGTNVATFSDTGAVTLDDSTASTTAFQLQSASGANLLTGDSYNNLVNIGELNTPTDVTAAASYSSAGTMSPGNTYTYEVTAVNSYGGQTNASSLATATVSGSTGSNTNNSITISWDAVLGASSYDVYRCTGSSFSGGCSGAQYQNTGSTSTTFIDTGSSTTTVANTITVGSDPTQVAVNPAYPTYAYVTNEDSNSVSIINASGSVNSTVSEYPSTDTDPDGIAVNSTGTVAYVVNAGSNTISIINLSDNGAVGTWSQDIKTNVCNDPTDIVLNPNGVYAYVTCTMGEEVQTVNLQSDQIVNTISTAFDYCKFQSAAFSGSTLYMVGSGGTSDCLGEYGNGFVIALNVNNYTYSSAALFSGTDSNATGFTVAVNSSGSYIYVGLGNSNPSSIDAIPVNGTSLGSVTSISGQAPIEGIALSPIGNYIYMTNYDDNEVTPGTVSGSSDTLSSAVTTGTDPVGIAINPSGSVGYVANKGSGTVTVLDLETVVSGSPSSTDNAYGIQLNTDGQGIFEDGLQAYSLDTPAAGYLNIGSTNAEGIDLDQNTTLASGKSLLVQGSVDFQNNTNSTGAFDVQNDAGTNILDVDTTDDTINLIGQLSGSTGNFAGSLSADSLDVSSFVDGNGGTSSSYIQNNSTTAFYVQKNILTLATLDVDTTDDTVGIGSGLPGSSYALNVQGNGDINASNELLINATAVCTTTSAAAGGCIAASGSSYYIQANPSTAQSANFNVSGTGTIGSTLTVDGDLDADNQTTIQTASTSALLVQSTSGSPTLSVDTSHNAVGIGTAASSSYTLTVGGNTDITGTLLVSGAATFDSSITVDGHYISGGSTPVPTLGSAAGSGGSVSVSGDDTLGTITINVGSTGLGTGALANIAFNTPFTANTGAGDEPRIVISPDNATAATADYYTAGISNDGFSVDVSALPSSGNTYTFNYFVGQ